MPEGEAPEIRRFGRRPRRTDSVPAEPSAPPPPAQAQAPSDAKPRGRVGPRKRRAPKPRSGGGEGSEAPVQASAAPASVQGQLALGDQPGGGVRRKRRRRKQGKREEPAHKHPVAESGEERDPDSAASGGDDSTPSEVVEGASPAARTARLARRKKRRRERPEPPPIDRNAGFWWADQWLRSVEILYPSSASRSRAVKGRLYARRGHVLELEVGPNGVLAKVVGSRPKPYQVRIELNRLRRETWGRILHQMAGKAAFLAQLLDGNLPPEIEDVFFSAGARLFPAGDNDIRSRCTCPDPVVPCKHVSAVHHMLAEALQRDPLLLFALRGKTREQFLQDLRDMRGRESARREIPVASEQDLAHFWRMGRLSETVLRATGWGNGGDPARLLHSLGEPQLEGIREGLFTPLLESTYRQVSEGMRRLPKG